MLSDSDEVSKVNMALPAALLSFIWIAYLFYRRRERNIVLSSIPGPESQSLFIGNSPEVSLPDCGVTEREWQEKYGHVVRFKAAFGEDRLWITDPQALQHILQASGYNYKKPNSEKAVSLLISDRGLTWAEGDVHKRQRKVMAPAFGMPESKALMQDFRNAVESIVDSWTGLISTRSSEKSTVIDIPSWISRGTLDAMGKAAFNVNFGAVRDPDAISKAFKEDIFVSAFRTPSVSKMFWDNLTNDIPFFLLYIINNVFPGASLRRLRSHRAEMREVARNLHIKKKNDLRNVSEGGRDVMSKLIKSNESETRKNQLKDHEIIPQMRTVLVGGHLTTANTISWTLYELARHPYVQTRLRAEMLDARSKAQARGNVDVTANDFENMPYTIAVMKESLRLHPITVRINREATKDDVVPLYTPLVTRSGKIVKEIIIPKGTNVSLSIHGYNLNKNIWGPDANDFNPERWFSPMNQDVPSVGVYGNLLTFSAGVRSCIGWRFAVIEMQTFLISLITNFEFSIPKGSKKIRMDRSGAMTPMLEGESERKAQLPLKVTALTSSF